MESVILQGLNPQQTEAVKAVDTPLLVIAGPGSGKTKVITHRVAYLIYEKHVSPFEILGLTFTNKAASEMNDRVSGLLDNSVAGVTISTFHSFCAMLLRRESEKLGLKQNFTIYDDQDQVSLVKKLVKQLDIDVDNVTPRTLLSQISKAKSKMVGWSTYQENAGNYIQEFTAKIYEEYEAALNLSSALDFDDLLLKTYHLFRDYPEVVSKYQERFKYVMIDEFQDTNITQYAISKQLALATGNLAVVGDPNQSIYSWRNADIHNILSFHDDFPTAKVVNLDQNYRSTRTILETAQNLISPNTEKFDQKLWTENSGGQPIVIGEGYNEKEEAEMIISEINNIVSKGEYSLSDIAIMYRVNSQSRALEEKCIKYGIKYQLVGSLKFYQRQEIKVLIAFLRLINNPDDDVSLLRVINVPARGIGQKTLSILSSFAVNSKSSIANVLDQVFAGESSIEIKDLGLTKAALKNLFNFREMMADFKGYVSTRSLPELIEIIFDQSGYKNHIMNESENYQERNDNIRELINTAGYFSKENTNDSLSAFLESVSLVGDTDNLSYQGQKLTLITLHQSKGLEFPVVFISGLEDGMLPHIRSIDSENPSELEEERRLCYVGVTRAKERLYLLRSFRRGFRGEPSLPSRFLADITKAQVVSWNFSGEKVNQSNKYVDYQLHQDEHFDLGPDYDIPEYKDSEPKEEQISFNQFKVGDKVAHKVFGDGIIIGCKPIDEDQELQVAFKDGIGIKKLLGSFAKLEEIN